jgi:hypothetical protein
MSRVLKLELITWPLALFIAGILLWYEQYKLSGNPGSVWLFTVLSDWLHIHGYERPFRLGVASMEILASILVINVPTRIFGAALALGVMSGAIFFHTVSPLGIDPYNDGGSLFKQACAVWLAAALILLVFRHEVRALIVAVLARRRPAMPV